jgi:hypothetical protein
MTRARAKDTVGPHPRPLNSDPAFYRQAEVLALGRRPGRDRGRIRLSHGVVPPSLAGTVPVDGLGLPRYWLHAWTVLFANELKPSTKIKTYVAADHLYRTARLTRGEDCLDRLRQTTGGYGRV